MTSTEIHVGTDGNYWYAIAGVPQGPFPALADARLHRAIFMR